MPILGHGSQSRKTTVEIMKTKLDTYIICTIYIYIYIIYIYTYIFIMKGLVVLQNSTSFLAPGNWPRPDADRAHFTGKLAVDAGTHALVAEQEQKSVVKWSLNPKPKAPLLGIVIWYGYHGST